MITNDLQIDVENERVTPDLWSTRSGVVSLLEMLELNAAEFAAVVGDLERTLSEADIRSRTLRNRLLDPRFNVVENPTPLTAEEKKEFIETLEHVINHCAVMKLANTHNIASYYKTLYDTHSATWSNVRNDTHAILLSLYSELQREIFLKLDSTQSQLFSAVDDQQHFGNTVVLAFPSAGLDIHEAGNCLALERWPATVFHCMRVFEIGLSALAAKFGITSINWHNIIQECEAKIKNIDSSWGADWKDQQKFYSEAARHFMFIKDAWRNHIMHVRDVFDEGRALSVWQHTKEFMQQISKGLHE